MHRLQDISVFLSKKKKLFGLHIMFKCALKCAHKCVFMCISLTECSSVADSASDGVFLHVSASSRDKNLETKRCNGEQNKTTNPTRNYFYVSITFWPKFIKYRYSENR